MRKLKQPTIRFVAGSVAVCQSEHSSQETIYQATKRKYPKYANNFAVRFTQATGKGFVWKNVTPSNLDIFVQYLYNTGLSFNSVNQYCKKLKAVINIYYVEQNINKQFKEILTVPTDHSYFVYIKDDEVKKLLDYVEILEEEMEKFCSLLNKRSVNHKERRLIILKQFLAGIFTGARHSDYVKFTWKNIKPGVDTNGNEIYVLTYTSEKTGIKADVPIPSSSPVIKIIKNMPTTVYPDAIFNSELRLACKEAGLDRTVKYHCAGVDKECKLYEAITSHTARRSFASNFLSNGADVLDVMHFMGHTNPKQTIGYNCAGPKFDASIISKMNEFYK